MPRWIVLVLFYLAAGSLRAACEPPPPAEARAAPGRYRATLDPARMSARELRQLPGVGEKRARAIERARRAHDPARGALRWTDVRGIGPRTVERIRAWFVERGAGGEGLLAPGGEPSPPGNAGADGGSQAAAGGA